MSTNTKPLTKQELLQISGQSGTQVYGGFFQEEPNAQWRDESRVDLVEEMRRTDGAIKGVLNAIKTPILATEWSITTRDDSPEGEEMRAFIQRTLFGMKNRTWKDFLRESLTYLDFGHAAFELIWGFKDDRITIVDLAPRIQRSIFKWQLDNGQPGIVQLITNDINSGSNPQIPMDKLLVLTNDKEGDDITGQSVLRAAWKHYYAKDKLYRIGLIASERYGVGIPVITLPDGAGEAEKAAAEAFLSNLRSNEVSRLVLPNPNWKFEIITVGGTGQNAIMEQQINHHNRQIMLAVLATFLGLGSDSAGSFALSKDQSSFFLKKVEDHACYLSEQINRLIKRIIFYSFGDQFNRLADNDLFPTISYAPLGDIDFAEYSNVIKTLTDSGYIDANDPNIAKFVRGAFKMPQLTDEQLEDMEESELEKQIQEDLPEDDEDDDFDDTSDIDDELAIPDEDEDDEIDEDDDLDD